MPDRAPFVSVVIPTYNRLHSLPRAVESVLRQTFDDFELIVVDDCSKDGTIAYLESIGDPRLRIIRHEVNGGANAARNTGVRAARAEWVAFQDSDDEWLVTKLARQVDLVRSLDPQEYGANYCGKIVYGRDLASHGPRRAFYMPALSRKTVEGDLTAELLQHAIISTQTLMVRKALLDQVGGFDEKLRIGQDWELTVRLSRVTKIGFVEEPLVMTFVMDDSISLKRVNAAKTWQAITDKHIDLIGKDKRLHARNLTEIARIHQRAGDWRSSTPFLQEALKVHGTDWRAWRALAAAYAMRVAGRWREPAQ